MPERKDIVKKTRKEFGKKGPQNMNCEIFKSVSM